MCLFFESECGCLEFQLLAKGFEETSCSLGEGERDKAATLFNAKLRRHTEKNMTRSE